MSIYTKRSSNCERSKIGQRNGCIAALTFGFSSAMVNLLALLDTATQRTRARARARSRFNNSNRTCALTAPRASTVPPCEWLREVTRGWTRSLDTGGRVSVPVKGTRHDAWTRKAIFRFIFFPFSVTCFMFVSHMKPTPHNHVAN